MFMKVEIQSFAPTPFVLFVGLRFTLSLDSPAGRSPETHKTKVENKSG